MVNDATIDAKIIELQEQVSVLKEDLNWRNTGEYIDLVEQINELKLKKAGVL